MFVPCCKGICQCSYDMNVFPCLTDVQVEQKILTVVLNYEFSLVL